MSCRGGHSSSIGAPLGHSTRSGSQATEWGDFPMDFFPHPSSHLSIHLSCSQQQLTSLGRSISMNTHSFPSLSPSLDHLISAAPTPFRSSSVCSSALRRLPGDRPSAHSSTQHVPSGSSHTPNLRPWCTGDRPCVGSRRFGDGYPPALTKSHLSRPIVLTNMMRYSISATPPPAHSPAAAESGVVTGESASAWPKVLIHKVL
jgi:hypothetical protein